MSTPSPDIANQRVSYRDGILLDASDFQKDQQYHRTRLALALSHIHGFGTIAGLKVEHTPPVPPIDATTGEGSPAEQLVVNPGIALDRAGHLIEIKTKQCLRLNRWFKHQIALPGAALKPFRTGTQRFFVADLFLRFNEYAQGLRPGFPEPAADATDAIVPSRTNDSFELQLISRDCDPETDLPKVPVARFPTPPGNTRARLDAVYAAYERKSPAIDQEYPPGFADKNAVFLSRIRIRLENTPSTTLTRHSTGEVVIDDLARPIVTATDLLFHLLPA